MFSNRYAKCPRLQLTSRASIPGLEVVIGANSVISHGNAWFPGGNANNSPTCADLSKFVLAHGNLCSFSLGEGRKDNRMRRAVGTGFSSLEEVRDQPVDPVGLFVLNPVRGVLDPFQAARLAEGIARPRQPGTEELDPCSPR